MAQSSGLVDEWPMGRVYLATGDSISGKITYHRSEDLVRILKPDGSVVAYAPVAVRGFEAIDNEGRYRRVFVTQRWNFGNDYSDFLAPAFFEQIVIGKYGLLKRETMTRRDISRDPMYRNPYYPYGYGGYPMGGPMYVDQRLENFFILLPNGKVKELRNVKKDLELIYGKKSGAMKEYVRQNKLKYTSLPDLAKIVSYLGAISQPEVKTTSVDL
ncbi:hypothetical protein ACD591_01800 [Rufibacter glacialis]|uniref:Uncharacterized protein n=1 Tax=Rufibacter glacialis TaxID=1259555 RepID=A0A5M8QHW1_9BACT|nr:hypothetical protein [Rufibacter glacialis]KAA6435625.1 hypothetical protein FOE74_06700 [Rufibacter glacialis]GGK65080.1 hypothetical protein GCM10011405_11380 [Rufibacter glacialis]